MSRVIYVSKIPYGVASEIEQVFEVFGEIESTKMGTSSCVIVYKRAEDAQAALDLNDTDLGGFKLEVVSQPMAGSAQTTTPTPPPPPPPQQQSPPSSPSPSPSYQQQQQQQQQHHQQQQQHNQHQQQPQPQQQQQPTPQSKTSMLNNEETINKLHSLLKTIETNCNNRIEKYNNLAIERKQQVETQHQASTHHRRDLQSSSSSSTTPSSSSSSSSSRQSGRGSNNRDSRERDYLSLSSKKGGRDEDKGRGERDRSRNYW